MKYTCFNPCCHGLAIAAGFAECREICRVLGFNPCCHGLAIAADYVWGVRHWRKTFQSLLSWISHCGRVCGC